MRGNAFTRWFACAALSCGVHLGAGWAHAEDGGPGSEPTLIGRVNAQLDAGLGKVNEALFAVLFQDVAFGHVRVVEQDTEGKVRIDPTTGQPKKRAVPVPFIVCVLILGAVFFTLWYRFVNVRGFRHAIDVVRGKYDDAGHEGDISHFRALTSALSATVGLGNIAGVAIAIKLGGPGAVFWMIVAAFFGMSAKFSESTLAQLYRRKNPDGTISGGPMYYLDIGFARMGWRRAGKVFAVVYAIMVMGGSLGGGNMFQANQSFEAVSGAFGVPAAYAWVYGLVLAVLVGLVILGGIRRIGAATSRIVPAMVSIYVAASLFIILTHAAEIPAALGLILEEAFYADAAYGGVVGVLVWGVQRASFSNEAGLGSSAIAHAAARTDEPVREGLVAMMEPFVDTIVVCLMTALVVIITGAWNDPANAEANGVALTSAAFATVLGWFPSVLAVCVLLFAYSTMISWAYYGERGWIYLLDHFGQRGQSSLVVYRVVFVCFVYVGAVMKLGAVLDFSDAMILMMAFPNIVGSALLAPRVRRVVQDYWARYRRDAR
jgi:alanine or glycine:cation symporter, AGCS family